MIEHAKEEKLKYYFLKLTDQTNFYSFRNNHSNNKTCHTSHEC